MNSIAPAQLIENLSWRYATKQFDSARKIPADQWTTLEQAMTLSPSSFGLQPWGFVVVTDPKVREKLRSVSWNQPQITDASHLVVFCAKTNLGRADVQRYIDRIAQVRGVPQDALAGFRDMMLGKVEAPGADNLPWSQRQVYIALGFFLSAAAMLGIDACPMEGFDPAKYNEILGLTSQGLTATVIATAGYRSANDSYAALKKVRFEPSDIIKRV
ncbi:MAG: NAD(P)H-dependent oxidoreductase [Phycisphaerales bacterium]|nr:NAD(P)H-dependent oxidoreductase [Phycisphaerales bacterium]